MQMRQRLKIVAETSLIWIISLSILQACAGLSIKTWFLDGKLGMLIRRDSSGNVSDERKIADSDGYLCYSPSDDEAWRNDLITQSQCCKSKNFSFQSPKHRRGLALRAESRESLLE